MWDGSRFVPAAATFRITGTTPEYESTDFVISRGGMAEAQNYWRIDNTLATTTHGHLAFYLLGDGQNFVAGADGIYRLAAELKVTPGDLGAPLFPAIAPFSILFQVDRWAADDPAQPAPFPDTDADLAAAFAHADLPRAAVRGVVVSPEPSGLSLLGLSGGILLRRRKS